jgi:hypothetical protein
MPTKKDNRLAWGVSLLVFGCLFLIKQLQILPPDIAHFLFDLRNYPFVIGIIFLLCHTNKNIGIVLIIVGLLFRLSDIIRYTQHISDFVLPVLLIISGAIMIFGRKFSK